jgi:hypothetical protein
MNNIPILGGDGVAPRVSTGSTGGVSINHRWCNPYGAETGGAKRVLGDVSMGKHVFHQWHCDNYARARYRIKCPHGHQGHIMELCDQHARTFTLREMRFCPACNIPPESHNCRLALIEVS